MMATNGLNLFKLLCLYDVCLAMPIQAHARTPPICTSVEFDVTRLLSFLNSIIAMYFGQVADGPALSF